MKAFRILTLTFLVSAALLSSCELVNPPEKIPSYIRIDTFRVEVNDFDAGSASHMLTVCYLSAGGQNLGVFEMPFTIPCLETGLQTLTIRPGIKLNGIAASRIDYPFFEPYITDRELHEGEIHIIEPVTSYKEACKFPWIEDFDDAGVSLLYKDYSETFIINQKEVLKEGRYSGAIFLDEEKDIFEANSDEDFDLPKDGSPVLLEFDYKNTNGFEIGMYLIEEDVAVWYDLVYVKPSDEWKRFYVDIGQTATIKYTTELFRIGFRAFFEPENGSQGAIYLDNIKLIHF